MTVQEYLQLTYLISQLVQLRQLTLLKDNFWM